MRSRLLHTPVKNQKETELSNADRSGKGRYGAHGTRGKARMAPRFSCPTPVLVADLWMLIGQEKLDDLKIRRSSIFTFGRFEFADLLNSKQIFATHLQSPGLQLQLHNGCQALLQVAGPE
jgi:hypothetical protein